MTLDYIYKLVGRKTTFFIGTVIAVISALGLIFINFSISWPIYIISILMGIEQALTLNTGLNLIK